jgi:hypothetical protein
MLQNAGELRPSRPRQIFPVDLLNTNNSEFGCARVAGSKRIIHMHHLGGISGVGSLKSDGQTVGRVDYDIDGFLTKPDRISGCGEIRMSPDALRQVFGRSNLKLLTEDGRLLSLRFSEKRLPLASDAAHVDVSGDLPRQSEWRN